MHDTKTLNDMLDAELIELAGKLKIQGIESLSKQDLIAQIEETQKAKEDKKKKVRTKKTVAKVEVEPIAEPKEVPAGGDLVSEKKIQTYEVNLRDADTTNTQEVSGNESMSNESEDQSEYQTTPHSGNDQNRFRDKKQERFERIQQQNA